MHANLFISLAVRVAIATALAAAFLPAAGCDSRAAEVKDSMTRLINANEARDADTVASLYSRNTIEYYDEIVRLSREATREQISRLPLHQQLEVLSSRLRFSLADLKSLNGTSYVKRLVRDKSWAVEWGIEDYGSVKVTGNSAWMKISDGTSRRQRGINARFYLEDQLWKLDETSLHDLWDKVLSEEQGASGIGRDKFMVALLEEMHEKSVPPTIWDPPKR